jgi:hypothetical protein
LVRPGAHHKNVCVAIAIEVANLGFLAQEVIEVEKANGGIAGDLLVADDEMDGLLRITETKMIPALVKAIQELKTLVDAQAARIATLEAR